MTMNVEILQGDGAGTLQITKALPTIGSPSYSLTGGGGGGKDIPCAVVEESYIVLHH